MEEKIKLLAELLLLLGAAGGTVYGVRRFFKKGVALFAQIVACAMFCMTLGQLLRAVGLFIHMDWQGLNLGMLGPFGCYCFLFSANFGQIDSLVDSGEREFRKYRLRALLVPLLFAIGYGLILLAPLPLGRKLLYLPFFCVCAGSAYLSFKHLIIPDVEHGVVRALRSYNVLALAMTILHTLAAVADAYGRPLLRFACYLPLALACALLLPVLRKGVAKWTD